MNTIVFHPESDPNAVRDAAAILRRGGLLGIPTETVYGLGADALNEDAVSRIFLAKGRPQDNPLIIHVPDASWLESYCRDVPPAAYQLAERFWPGPLTMILPRRDIVPLQTTGGLETVGVRCPNHPVTLAIIEAAGVPIAAPSGNTSGRPSPTTAAHMIEDMDGRIDGIVDGGPCTVGVESTIIDLTVTPPRLLRPGGLPLESLRQVLGEVAVDKAVTGLLAAGERPRAPGMKYRHYAPHAPVTVVTGEPERSARRIQGLLSDTAGVICFDEYAPLFPGHIIHKLGPAADKSAQARHVFDALRTFDGTDVTEIFAQCPDDGGLGLAVANRLKKAAGFHLIDADRPLIVGLTGGTGAGKTSALAALVDLGGTVLDCDAVYHQMLRTDPALREAIAAGVLPRRQPGPAKAGDLGVLRPRRSGPAQRHRVRISAAGANAPGGGTVPGGAGRHQPGGKRPGPAVRLHRGGAGPGGGSGPPHHGPGRHQPGLCPAADLRPAVRRLLPGALLPYPGKYLRRSGAVPGSGTDFLPENAPGNRTSIRRKQNHDRRNEGQARKAVLQPQKRL